MFFREIFDGDVEPTAQDAGNGRQYMKKKLVVFGLCGVICLLPGAVTVETAEWFGKTKSYSFFDSFF